MELEALAGTPAVLRGGWIWSKGRMSFHPLLNALADLAQAGGDPVHGASLFHGTVIDGLTALAVRGTAETGIRTVCLGGGCLQNLSLAEGLIGTLTACGLFPLLPRLVPANDGGLSLGQAALARAMFSRSGA